jgi:hypothetical protein
VKLAATPWLTNRAGQKNQLIFNQGECRRRPHLIPKVERQDKLFGSSARRILPFPEPLTQPWPPPERNGISPSF